MNAHLDNSDAIAKIQGIIGHNAVCLFGTALDQLPIGVRPMSTLSVTAEGDLWFFSHADSERNAVIAGDPRVQLFFAQPARSEYLTVFGQATIITDRSRIADLWIPLAKAWFPGGAADPALTAIRVRIEQAHYWDVEQGQAISFLGLLGAALTGRQVRTASTEGELHIN
jgi:general stress protein 26